MYALDNRVAKYGRKNKAKGKTRPKKNRDKPKVTEFDNEFLDLTQKSTVHKRKH